MPVSTLEVRLKDLGVAAQPVFATTRGYRQA